MEMASFPSLHTYNRYLCHLLHSTPDKEDGWQVFMKDIYLHSMEDTLRIFKGSHIIMGRHGSHW
eukprot:2971626-Ditylum_brightwellii.AAC.1